MESYEKNEKGLDAYHDNIIEILDWFYHLRTKHKQKVEYVYQRFGGKCDVLQCDIVKRHIRHRTRNDDESKQVVLDCRSAFVRQTMDKIHFYIRHEYDFGTRFTPRESQQLKAVGGDRTIALNILRKRQDILKQKQLNHDRKHRYVSTMNQIECPHYEAKDFPTYSYSLPFNYHPKCQHIHDVCWNGLTYSDLYVPPKYSSLKEELLAHSKSRSSVKEALEHAKLKLQTQYARAIKADSQYYLKQKANEPDHPCQYEYKDDAPLTAMHIAVVFIYCDDDAFQYGFSCSYRPDDQNKNEANDGDNENVLLSILNNIKSRNSEYYHFAKLLKETVEVFGTQYMDLPRDPSDNSRVRMYHGVSRCMVLPGFECKIFGVLSATTDRNVAWRFAEGDDDGLILEMVPSVYLKSFYCSPFSPHPHEEEHLFVGGLEPFNIINIEYLPKQPSSEDIAKKRHAILIPEEVVRDIMTASRVIDCMTNGLMFSNHPADYHLCEDIKDTVKVCTQKLLHYRLMVVERKWSLDEMSDGVARLLKQMCDTLRLKSLNSKSAWTIPELSSFVAKLLTVMCDTKRCIQIDWESLGYGLRRMGDVTGGCAGYMFLKASVCTNGDSNYLKISKINKLFPFMLNLVVHNMDKIEALFLDDILQYIQNRNEKENRRIDCFDLVMSENKMVDDDTFRTFVQDFESVKTQGDIIWEVLNTYDKMLMRSKLMIRIVPEQMRVKDYCRNIITNVILNIV
eukprot:264287_1